MWTNLNYHHKTQCLEPEQKGVLVLGCLTPCGGSSCHCANSAQFFPQPHVKCDTSLGPLRHAFSVCVHYIVACECICSFCVCALGGGQASVFTRTSAAAVHWYVSGSVPVVIQEFRRWLGAVWSRKVHSHSLSLSLSPRPVQDLQPDHGGSVPVQRHRGEDREGQPHQGDRPHQQRPQADQRGCSEGLCSVQTPPCRRED